MYLKVCFKLKLVVNCKLDDIIKGPMVWDCDFFLLGEPPFGLHKYEYPIIELFCNWVITYSEIKFNSYI